MRHISASTKPAHRTLTTLADKALGKTARTDFFEKVFVGLFWKLGAPVPYAFRTIDGDVRSLDAGCIKFLANRGSGYIQFHLSPDRTILAATPGVRLLSTFEPLRQQLVRLVSPEMPTLLSSLDFDLADPVDERRRRESLLVIREGQRSFRKEVLSVWKRCAVTGSRTSAVIEAAHLHRYLGPKTNDIRNGIALRADIHVLFDKHLIGFEPTDRGLKVTVSKCLRRSEYRGHDGLLIISINDEASRPDRGILRYRFEEFRTIEASRADD
ncbi:hypothetical protein GOB50_33255 [Sinorhizobium meliloti]|nr:hypothetical protein [Sinorhizobium meliloti]